MAAFVRDLPQCGEHSRCMLKVALDEAMGFLVDTSTCLGHCRVIYDSVCKLINIQGPDLAVSGMLRWHRVISGDVSGLPGCKATKRFLNDIALGQLAAYVVQSQGLQRKDVVLQRRFVRHHECISRARDGPCLRVGRWTSGTVWERHYQRG